MPQRPEAAYVEFGYYEKKPFPDTYYALKHRIDVGDRAIDSEEVFIDAVVGLVRVMRGLELDRLERAGQLEKKPCDICGGHRTLMITPSPDEGASPYEAPCDRCDMKGWLPVHVSEAEQTLKRIHDALNPTRMR